MTPPVSVLYDFSPLAPVADDHAQYTGIQRVACETAAGLASSPQVRLTLYPGLFLRLCEKFAAREPRLRGCAFLRTPGGRWLDPVLDRLQRLARRHLDDRSVAARIVRKVSSLLLGAGARWKAHLESRQLAAFSIYHTPVYAFPNAVQRSPRLKKFLTVYDLTPVKVPQYSHAAIVTEYRRLLASVPQDAYFLCISEHTKKDWCEYTGVSPERCYVTPLAAGEHFAPCHDPARLEAVRLKYRIPPGRYYLSVSTLEPRKNLSLVIRAFSRLLEQSNDDDLYLVLSGRRGWHEDQILQAAAGSSCFEKMIFTGYVDEEDLAAVYSGALAFLYMSFYEGFGLPPLEAMQCGVPTVTSNTSSLPEVVGSAGIMLDPLDEEGLCAVMRRLRDDEKLRADLRERALDQARRFTWQRCVDQTIAAYRSALASE